MVNVSIKYTGDLHCDATHGPSHAKLATDALRTTKAKAKRFRHRFGRDRTWTCISTTMGIKAKRLGKPERDDCEREKEMSKDAPRRIVGLPSEVHIPLPPNSPHREVLEQTALNCPVHKSLPPEINRPTNFFGKADLSSRTE